MLTDQTRREATPEDVWTWRANGCSYHEIGEYTGLDENVVRAMEFQAIRRMARDDSNPVQKLGIPVEHGAQP